MHVESERRRECRVLVIGATGHLGRHIVRACADAGHRTYALIRPAALSSALLDPERSLLIQSFKDAHVRIIQGSLEDHAVLVAALKQVNVVVSVLGTGSLLKQLQLIKVMKIVGNIERFIPSEFGVDVDRITPIPALQTMFEGKVLTRRAIEAASIPYTYISSNCLASSFLGCLLQPGHSSPPSDRVVIYGTGDVKGVYVDELDVATYTAKTIDDPRTINKTLYIRPPLNILTQNEMVSMWESKSQKKLEKMHLSDLGMEVKVQEAPYPISALLALIYIVCIRGDTTNFDIEENCCEACMLYSDVNYTTASNYLDQFLLNL